MIGHQFTTLTTFEVFNLASSISPPPFVLGCKRVFFFFNGKLHPNQSPEKEKPGILCFFAQKIQALIRSSGMTLLVSNEQVLSGGWTCLWADLCFASQRWVFPKIGGFYPPKWMVKRMETPIEMDDLGRVPVFSETSGSVL